MMAMRYILATLALLTIICAEAAESRIFKTVDEHGNVVFTDIPPREDDQDAQQIVVEQPNSFAVDEATPAQDQWIVDTPEADEAPPFRYDDLSIVSPANDEPVRENAGNVTIVANVNPRLQPGHLLRLIMDGNVAQDATRATTFSLTNVDRGTHSLTLQIVDGEGNVLMHSPDSTFHMMRYAIPPRTRPNPAG